MKLSCLKYKNERYNFVTTIKRRIQSPEVINLNSITKFSKKHYNNKTLQSFRDLLTQLLILNSIYILQFTVIWKWVGNGTRKIM